MNNDSTELVLAISEAVLGHRGGTDSQIMDRVRQLVDCELNVCAASKIKGARLRSLVEQMKATLDE